MNDERIGCLLVGPGMGDIPQLLTLALTSKASKVLDADAISHLGDPDRLKGQDAVITRMKANLVGYLARSRGPSLIAPSKPHEGVARSWFTRGRIRWSPHRTDGSAFARLCRRGSPVPAPETSLRA